MSAGGAGTTAPTVGSGGNNDTGGGGGGVGIIRLSAETLVTDNAVISPPATLGPLPTAP